jgi:hypothetical protein
MHSVNQEIEGTRVKRHQDEGSAHDARFRIIQPLVIGHIGGGTASENEPDEERIIYGLNQHAGGRQMDRETKEQWLILCADL